MARPKILAERFWPKVDKRGPEECWPWKASTNPAGYGQIYVLELDRPIQAPRISWELTHGPIPSGLHVCHHCDNPPCVNPAHLFLGTMKDNMADRDRKGRGVKPPHLQGMRHHQAKLTDDQVLAIRADRRPQRVVGAEYGVSQSMVWYIRNKRAWTHL